LVAADGTIDWWCPGRFDADADFFRLIDPGFGGAVRVGPVRAAAGAGAAHLGRQAYDPRSNVVRTRLSGPGGEVEVADFMPWPGGTERPAGRIVRLVTGLRGPVEVAIELVPGHRFGVAGGGKVTAWSEGVVFDGIALRCGLEPAVVPQDRDRAKWVASTTLAPGERLVVTVDDIGDDRHQPLSRDAAARLLEETSHAWSRHLEPLAYDGPYRAPVERSLLAVKALTHYATGGLVSAPTTSLPEVVRGERNYDGRYAWIKDASAAATVWRACGLVEDAEGCERWLRTVIEGAEFPLASVFDVEGGPARAEEELGLAGRLRSQPVRVGVARSDEAPACDLDVYGDLLTAVETAPAGGPLTAVREDLYRMADWVADHWDQPDRGVWDVRGAPQPFVASRVQCWHFLDRMVRRARAHNPLELATIGWQQAAAEILSQLEREGLAGATGGLRRVVSTADAAGGGGHRRDGRDDSGDVPDAALLRIAWQGPWPADHPIVTDTVNRVIKQLTNGPYLYRYPPDTDDGAPGTPPADMVASFWAVRALAATRQWEAAHERMEALTSVGLIASGTDPLSGEMLGNYPSAAGHLALVEAARALAAGPR
jgi:GH15 family glucan-1,4-alpha-glucosidase